MPTSTAITASVGHVRRSSAANTAADCHAPAAVVGGAAGLLGAPDRPARGDVGALVDRPRPRRRRRRAARAAVTPTSPSTRHRRPGGTGRAPSGRRRPGRSACTARCRCGSRTRRRTRAAGRTRSSASDATGVPLRPSTPHAERVVVGDQALGLERREHRRAEPLGERAHRVGMPTRAPWPTMITGRRAPAMQPRQRVRRAAPAARCAGRRGGPPAGAARRVGAGSVLHLVGEHEVRDAALVDARA